MAGDGQSEPSGRPLQLGILGGFRFSIGGRDIFPSLPGGSQRLLAFLALCKTECTRDEVARSLWPDASEARRDSSLRAALHRLSPLGHEAVLATEHALRLSDDVALGA